MADDDKDLSNLTLGELKELMTSQNMGAEEKKKIFQTMFGASTDDIEIATDSAEKVTVKKEKITENEKPKNGKETEQKEDEWEECGSDALPECKQNAPQKSSVPDRIAFNKDVRVERFYHTVEISPIEQSDLGNDLFQHYLPLTSEVNVRQTLQEDGKVTLMVKLIFNSIEDASNCAEDMTSIRDNMTVVKLQAKDYDKVSGSQKQTAFSTVWSTGWVGFGERTIYVCGLPPGTTEEQIEELYPDSFFVLLFSDPVTGEPTGDGVVEFKLREEARAYGTYHSKQIGDAEINGAYYGRYELFMYKRELRDLEYYIKEPLTPDQRDTYVKALRTLRKKQADFAIKKEFTSRQKQEVMNVTATIANVKDVFLQDNELRIKKGLLKKALPKDVHDYMYPGGKVPPRNLNRSRIKYGNTRPKKSSIGTRGGATKSAGGSTRTGATSASRGRFAAIRPPQPGTRSLLGNYAPEARGLTPLGGPIRGGAPIGRGGRGGERPSLADRPGSSLFEDDYDDYPPVRRYPLDDFPAVRRPGPPLDDFLPIKRPGPAIDDFLPIKRPGPAIDDFLSIRRPGSPIDDYSPNRRPALPLDDYPPVRRPGAPLARPGAFMGERPGLAMGRPGPALERPGPPLSRGAEDPVLLELAARTKGALDLISHLL